MNGYIPQLNAVGVYTLKAPYDSLVTPQVAYTCRSLRSLSDIAAAGDLIWEQYYEPLGVSMETYQQDLSDNVFIVGLQAGTGEWIYVPSSHILKAPDLNGVLYSPVLLGVNLGPVPDTMQLDGLIAKIQNVVEASIGIMPQIKGVLISQPALVPLEDSKRLEEIRAAKITDAESDYAKVQRLTSELEVTRSKLAELEAWVRTRI